MPTTKSSALKDAIQEALGRIPEPEGPLRLVLPSPPTGNLYYRHVGNKTLISAAGRAFKSQVAGLALAQGVQAPFRREVRVTVDWYRPQRRGDLDNILKCLFDSLNGVAWADDKQVARLVASRYDDPADPRVEVRVEPIEPLPPPSPGPSPG